MVGLGERWDNPRFVQDCIVVQSIVEEAQDITEILVRPYARASPMLQPLMRPIVRKESKHIPPVQTLLTTPGIVYNIIHCLDSPK